MPSPFLRDLTSDTDLPTTFWQRLDKIARHILPTLFAFLTIIFLSSPLPIPVQRNFYWLLLSIRSFFGLYGALLACPLLMFFLSGSLWILLNLLLLVSIHSPFF